MGSSDLRSSPSVSIPPVRGAPGLDEISALVAAVLPVVRRRVSDPDRAADLCQEAIARTIEARDRLDAGALVPYAVTVAKHLVVDAARLSDRDRRHQHRLLDREGVASPEEEVVAADQRQSVHAALGHLDEADRRILTDHIVEGLDTTSMARRRGVSAGAVATHLARARAKLRVEYVLAAYRVEPPTLDCRPVLVSLSAADQRRQDRLGAGEHLAGCATCTRLAPPLVERDRRLLGAAPVGAPIAAWLVVKGAIGRHPFPTAAAATGGVVAAVGVAVLVTGGGAPAPSASAPVSTTLVVPVVAPAGAPASTEPPSSAPAPPPDLSIDGQALEPLLATGALGARDGGVVTARQALVGEVPADEGFWMSGPPGQRVWVQLVGNGESPATITPGSHISFLGRLVHHGPGFAANVGLAAQDGGDELDRSGVHIEVPNNAVLVGP